MKLTLSLALFGAVTLCNILLMQDALHKTEQMHQRSLALVSTKPQSLEDRLSDHSIAGLNLAQVEQVKTLMMQMPIGK